MFQGKYIFSQIVEFIPRREFNQFIERYNGNNRIKNLDCRDQFLALIFGQLTNLHSLRGIVLLLGLLGYWGQVVLGSIGVRYIKSNFIFKNIFSKTYNKTCN